MVVYSNVDLAWPNKDAFTHIQCEVQTHSVHALSPTQPKLKNKLYFPSWIESRESGKQSNHFSFRQHGCEATWSRGAPFNEDHPELVIIGLFRLADFFGWQRPLSLIRSLNNIVFHSHFACCRSNPIVALQLLEQFGAHVANVSNANGANQLHFLFCAFAESRDFDCIFNAADFLLHNGVDENQRGNDDKTPRDYAQKKFGNQNEIIWRVSASLNANSAAELRQRYESMSHIVRTVRTIGRQKQCLHSSQPTWTMKIRDELK